MPATFLDEYLTTLDFDLDDFQLQGCRAVEEDRGVLVCAPTGAGKTAVGEFAVALALSRGTKCFYTTPIKALSNQKYHDLVEIHGEDAVGLLTGDQSINSHAEIVVMTTEVLRNMIYARSDDLDRLSHVVMDEIHFLADASRGAVWEEVILNLDESVRIIGLSATVSNSEEFGDWLSTVRGETDVIVTEHRPVPLDQWMLVNRRLLPLFEPGETDAAGRGKKVNEGLLLAVEKREAKTGSLQSWHASGSSGFRSRAKGSPDRGPKKPASAPVRHRQLSRPDVLSILGSQNMLPAITFIFSRAGCDGALFQCLRSKLVLTDEAESQEITRIVNVGVEGIPEEDLEVLGFRQWRAALARGFAAHHAGMLPAFRHIVEELFVKGLVKAVFATETLALGINMPARTVVLEKLVKFNGEAHVDLTPGQYTQLTGRAGRRGRDTMGNAVVMWAPAMDPKAVAGLASTRTYPLVSTFQPGYNMSINLLAANGFDRALGLLEQSFAQFQADGSVVAEVRDLERARVQEEELEDVFDRDVAALSPPSTGDPGTEVLEYVRLRQELSREEKDAKRRSREDRAVETVRLLAKLQSGEVIALPSKKRPTLAVVITPANQTKDPRPLVISETGWLGRIEAGSFDNPPIVLGRMKLPRNITHHPKKNTRFVIQAFRRNSFGRPKQLREKARTRTSALAQKLRGQIQAHPVHAWPDADRERLARTAERLERARKDVAFWESKVGTASDTLGRMFRRILDLLTEMDYVEEDEHGDPVVTEEGQRLAQVHSSSDLLIAQALRRGIWDGLDPAELAGTVSLCVFENRKESQGEPDAATDGMAVAMNHTMRLWGELSADEVRHNLPVTRMPEPAFALATHQWTAGAPLAYCLGAANESGAELTPGDFVRWCRQVIDALEQVAKTGYNDDIRRTARQAIDAMRRGVVAVGS